MVVAGGTSVCLCVCVSGGGGGGTREGRGARLLPFGGGFCGLVVLLMAKAVMDLCVCVCVCVMDDEQIKMITRRKGRTLAH